MFYNEKEPLHLQTHASGFGLGVGLLEVRDRMWFPRNEAPDNAEQHPVAFNRKKMTETRYINIEREALGILHGFEIFYYYMLYP